MKTTLIIFSGLPGTGKSTLAHLAVQKLQLPLLKIDDIVSFIPAHMSRHANPYWDDMIEILLNLAESQLALELSVMVDSVFMGRDRYQAYEIAQRNRAIFRPIYTYHKCKLKTSRVFDTLFIGKVTLIILLIFWQNHL